MRKGNVNQGLSDRIRIGPKCIADMMAESGNCLRHYFRLQGSKHVGKKKVAAYRNYGLQKSSHTEVNPPSVKCSTVRAKLIDARRDILRRSVIIYLQLISLKEYFLWLS